MGTYTGQRIEEIRRRLELLTERVETHDQTSSDHGSPAADVADELSAVVACLDLVAQDSARHGGDQRKGHLIRLLEGMPDGVCIVNRQYEVEYANPALERELGEVEVNRCYECFVDPGQEDVCSGCRLEDVFRGETARWEWVCARLEKTYDVVAMPLENRGGRISALVMLRDITRHKQTEEALERRHLELALLNQTGQALSSTLELDQVLYILLEEIRGLLGAVGSSVWLIDPETQDLVCREVTGSKSDVVLHWRLAPGEGIAGWVAERGESVIVPDIWADDRHYRGLDEQTGLPLRSILTVPLRVRDQVIGVLQVVDVSVDRFSSADLTLIEPLAATAAIAIENARLYDQARQDAQTKSTLLREVNHRVKNTLSSIIGLIYAERRHTGSPCSDGEYDQLEVLINRIQSLAAAHHMLSASEWAPLSLSDLAAQTIRCAFQMLPRDKRIEVDVMPSPVLVTPSQAHGLALVINELTTNTIKHALPDRSVINIKVRITLEGRWAVLRFQDDGSGYPPDVLALERHGVGFDLVQNIVGRELGGDLSLGNGRGNGAGATVKIRFPNKTGGGGE